MKTEEYRDDYYKHELVRTGKKYRNFVASVFYVAVVPKA
jgi:hypothetical protein